MKLLTALILHAFFLHSFCKNLSKKAEIKSENVFQNLEFIKDSDQTKIVDKKNISYGFGILYGDKIFQGDLSLFLGPIDLPDNFAFFGQIFNKIFINKNGILSFLTPVIDLIPLKFPLRDYISIAPFWNPIYLSKGSDIFYRSITNGSILDQISEDISQKLTYFNATWAFMVTWFQVDFSNKTEKSNTFQVLIATNGSHSYSIFNYENLEWTSNVNNKTFPEVGFNFGDGFRYLTVFRSTTEEMIDYRETSNVGIPGRWIYRIDDPNILTTNCSEMNPSIENSNLLSFSSIGGEEILINGLCLIESISLHVLIDNEFMAECKKIDFSRCFIKLPFLNRTGVFPLSILINNTEYNLGSFSFVEAPDIFDSLPLKVFNNLKKVYNLSSEVILFSISDIFFYQALFKYETYLVHFFDNGPTTSLLEPNINRTYILNSSNIYGIFEKKDIEIVYFALSFEFSGHLKYFFLVPVVIINNLPISDQNCKTWNQNQPDPYKISESLPSCPPALPSVQSELIFFFDFKMDSCNPSNTEICDLFHPGANVCYKSLFGIDLKDFLAHQQCCYDKNGSLLVGYPGGGSMDLEHATFLKSTNTESKILPYLRCCLLSDNCNLYFEKRPSDNGIGWKPPGFGGGAGDPHFTSFDGTKYTFNGYGKYIFFEIKETNYTVFVDLAPILNFDEQITNGTILKAIAIHGNGIDHVQIQSEYSQLIVKINSMETTLIDNELEIQKGFKIQQKRNMIGLVYENGINIEIDSTDINNALTIFCTIPQKYREKTTGLLGNFNGNSNDDFILPNGKVLYLNPKNDKDIYENFGQKWLISEDNILNRSYKSLQISDYLPVFLQDGIIDEIILSEKDEAIKLCGDDINCLFDFFITNDEEIAGKNLKLKAIISSYEKISKNQTNTNSSNSDSSLDYTTKIIQTSSQKEQTLITSELSYISSSNKNKFEQTKVNTIPNTEISDSSSKSFNRESSSIDAKITKTSSASTSQIRNKAQKKSYFEKVNFLISSLFIISNF